MKPKTKAFADKLLSDPKINQTQAYIETHQTNNRTTATQEATKLLRKPTVRIYMKKHVAQAKRNVVEIANDKSIKPDTRLKANFDILDRETGKAIQRTEVSATNLNLNVEASKEVGEAFTAFLKQQTAQK